MDAFALMGFVFGITAFVMISTMEKRMRDLKVEVDELRRRMPGDT